ncbi:MAG: ABC transporter permease [Planctomycetes bacterium]|nr:ABC transporter permease [Planctomycetota bacterium]
MDTLLLALASLRSHVLRSALTLFGIVIGITAVVGMSSIIRGVDEVILGQIRALNPNVLYLTRFGLIMSEEDWRSARRRPPISVEDLRAIEADCPTVGKADLFAEGWGELTRGAKRTRGLNVMGVGVNYPDVNSMQIRGGRFFASGEVAAAARVMLLGREPCENLFPGIDPVGRTVRLFRQEYTVIGTFVPQGEVGGMNIGQDNFCVIPWTTHRRDVSSRRESYVVAMVPGAGVPVERMVEEVATRMRLRHRLRAQQEDDFAFITQESIMKLWRELSGAVFLGLLGISSIALVVGGIGVMAVMMVAVTERVREIGVRRAVGARRGHVLAQFLVEAALLTAAGGALGSALGAAAAHGIAYWVELPVATPWDTFALAIGVSTVVGLVFGVMPAWRAARLDVVEALRAE